METQLARDTGTELKCKGLRAKAPSIEMMPILEKEDKEKPGEWRSAAPVIKWTLHRARVFGNIAKEATSCEYTWGTIEIETMDLMDDLQAGPYIKDAMPEDWEADVDQIRHMAHGFMEDCRCGNGFVAARCLMAWVDKIVDMLEDKQDRADRLDGKDHKAKWRQLVSDSAAKGAGAIHRWVMDPVGLKPETATRPDRTPSALPLHILERETARLAGIWQASDQKPEDPDIAIDPGEFGSVHFAQVAAAPTIFPTSTAESLDGFHVKHFAMLPKAGHIVVALLRMLIERYGGWPQQVKFALAALIPKATKGCRSIGVMPAICRMLANTKSATARAWEKQHAAPHLVWTSGNSCTEAAWWQCVRVEAGVQDKMEAASSCGICRTTMRMWTGRSW